MQSKCLLKKISEDLKDTTLIIATHRLPVVNSVDRVIVLADGKVVLDEPQEAAMKKLINNCSPELRRNYLLIEEKVSSDSIRYPLPFSKTCLASGVA